MSAPLSNDQKRYLSKLSRRAFNLECARARGRGEIVATGTKAANTFRHDQVAAACHKTGLTCCSQDDYKLVEAHLLNILGDTGRAFKAHMDAQNQPLREAQAVLCRELKRFNIHIGYAASICRNQFKCSLDDATAKQVWCLVYTVRNRGNARKQKQQ